MIRLIATDLDGTLLAGRSKLPQRNIDALRRAMDAGVYVVIASGRMPEAAIPLAERIGVNAPMILFNGAMSYDLRARRIINRQVIGRERAIDVLRYVESRGQYIQAFPAQGYFFARRDPLTDYYEDKIGVIGHETGMALSEWLSEDVYKLLCLGTPEQTNALQRDLICLFPDLEFIKSGGTHLEIIARGVNKASGLRAICEYLHIARDEVMAFGDEQNDMPMLEYAAAGYIMENAADALKKKIRYVAPKNTECGVASIINLYLNEKRMGG